MSLSNIPTVSFDEIFHVGTLCISNKHKHNHEGANGLSITSTPNAWRRINKGRTAGKTFSLTKPNNAFIDAHKLSSEQRDGIMSWGVMSGLVVECTLYKYSYFDDEMGCEFESLFYSLDDAIAEVEDENDIIEAAGYRGTERFAAIVGESNKDNLSLVMVAYCIQETTFDGVFWDDILDPSRYSAPRGVIVQQQLDSWAVTDMADNCCS